MTWIYNYRPLIFGGEPHLARTSTTKSTTVEIRVVFMLLCYNPKYIMERYLYHFLRIKNLESARSSMFYEILVKKINPFPI